MRIRGLRPRPSPAFIGRLLQFTPRTLFASEVTRFEMHFGAALRPDAPSFWNRLHGDVLSLVTQLPVSEAVGTPAGAVGQQQQRLALGPPWGAGATPPATVARGPGRQLHWAWWAAAPRHAPSCRPPPPGRQRASPHDAGRLPAAAVAGGRPPAGAMATAAGPRRGAFISQARADGEAAERRLHARLLAEVPEVPAWLDRMEIEGGVGWWRQIEAQLVRADSCSSS